MSQTRAERNREITNESLKLMHACRHGRNRARKHNKQTKIEMWRNTQIYWQKTNHDSQSIVLATKKSELYKKHNSKNAPNILSLSLVECEIFIFSWICLLSLVLAIVRLCLAILNGFSFLPHCRSSAQRKFRVGKNELAGIFDAETRIHCRRLDHFSYLNEYIRCV